MTLKPVRGQTVEELRQKFRTSEEQIVVSSERDRPQISPIQFNKTWSLDFRVDRAVM